MHIFISYSSKDEKEAFFACDILEQNGKKCFIAPRDIRPGKEYAEELINGIDDAYAMVLFFSNNANQSPHVLREVERAVSNMGCKCYLVGNGYYDENIQTENAGLEGYGVRPAITVDLDEIKK